MALRTQTGSAGSIATGPVVRSGGRRLGRGLLLFVAWLANYAGAVAAWCLVSGERWPW